MWFWLHATRQAAGNAVERILARTVSGRVLLDLDVVNMVRSVPARESVIVDGGTPMVRNAKHSIIGHA